MADFVLDSSALGGQQFSPRFTVLENGGQGKAFQYQVQDTTNSSDLELHNIGVHLSYDDESMENT